jgi:hypothetical protein
VNSKILGLGAGAAIVAVAGVLAYRQFGPGGPSPAAAATAGGASSSPSKVISLGSENKAAVEPGKIIIAPVTARQMPPKAADAKPKAPATQPAAPESASQKPAAGTTAKTAATIGGPVAKSAGPDATARAMIVKPQAAKPQAAKAAPATTQPLDTKAPQTKPRAKKTISIQGTPEVEGAASRLSPADKATISLLHQLHWLRSNISLWRMRHNGQDVDFANNPAWEQLVSADQTGQVLKAPPVNPFNGFTRVLPVRDEPRPGQPVAGTFGYVYAVSSGKLFATDSNGRVFDEGAVDAVALEQKAVRELPPQEARRQLTIALAAVRQQILVYAAQHNGSPPDFARYSAFEQLMKPTLEDGRVLEGAGPGRSGQVFGPYILSMPVNAVNGKYKVKVIAGEVRAGQKIDAAEVGWVFQAATGNFYALDASGCVIDDKATGATAGATSSGAAQPDAGNRPQAPARRTSPARR